jgi:hypothetical protein
MKLRILLYLLVICCIVLACAQKNIEWKGNIKLENGVEIIKNPKEPIYSGKILTLKEELSLGEVTKYQSLFYAVKELDVDNEQNIYVLDWMAGHILVFDQNGTVLRTIGRKGQGPGEFERPMDISIFGNKLMVHDLERGISFFTLKGEFIKSVTSMDVLSIWDVYCDSLGNIVAQNSPVHDPVHPRQSYRKYDHNMNMIFQFAETPRSGGLGPNNPFGAIGSIAIDREDNIIFGYPKDYIIEIFDANGKLIRKIEKEYSPLKLTDLDRREMKEENPGRADIDYPKYKPPFKRFFIDDEGRIYVGTWEKLGRSKSYYDIFDPEGKYLAKIDLMGKPILCRNGKMYSIESNDEGDQFVKRYKMIWR